MQHITSDSWWLLIYNNMASLGVAGGGGSLRRTQMYICLQWWRSRMGILKEGWWFSVYNELSVLELSSSDNPKQRKCVLEELFNFHHEVGTLQTLGGDWGLDCVRGSGRVHDEEWKGGRGSPVFKTACYTASFFYTCKRPTFYF